MTYPDSCFIKYRVDIYIIVVVCSTAEERPLPTCSAFRVSTITEKKFGGFIYDCLLAATVEYINNSKIWHSVIFIFLKLLKLNLI